MHNIFKALGLMSFVLLTAACSDWTEAEALQMTQYTNTEIAKKETYYQALRAWKQTPHAISFGWFGGWSNPAASTTNMLAGLPDSMDVVSLWDNSTNLLEGQKRDLEFVQKVKGTKVLYCSFTRYVGQGTTPKAYNTDEATREKFWGWETGNNEKQEAAVRKYANAIIDTISKYNCTSSSPNWRNTSDQSRRIPRNCSSSTASRKRFWPRRGLTSAIMSFKPTSRKKRIWMGGCSTASISSSL